MIFSIKILNEVNLILELIIRSFSGYQYLKDQPHSIS